VRQQPRLVQRGELDQADPVGEAGRGRRGGAQRKAGLADSARAGDRDEPGAVKQRTEPGELRFPADEAGRLSGEPPLLPRVMADEHAILTGGDTVSASPLLSDSAHVSSVPSDQVVDLY
jgi:hypothetical protein